MSTMMPEWAGAGREEHRQGDGQAPNFDPSVSVIHAKRGGTT